MTNNVSIIILSFNTKEITRVCIQKALEAADYSKKVLKNKVDVIVVDNASHDGTVEMVIEEFGNKIRLSAQKTNLGVPKGYNIGMKMSHADYMLVINSDLYLSQNSVVKSIEYMKSNLKCDAMMCMLKNGEGEHINSGGHLPTPLNTITWLLGIDSLPLLKRAIPRIYDFDQKSYQHERTIEWVPTCFFFIKRKVFDKTKGLDENLFLYMEDLEWCKRMKDLNLSIWYTPDFQSVHLCGMSAEKKLPSLYVMQRQLEGVKYYHKKHYPQTLPLIIFLIPVGYFIRSVFYFLVGQRSKSGIYRKVLMSPSPSL